MTKIKRILGIETSCDETAAAVLSFNGARFEVLGQTIASQVDLHKLTGGVVPEVAAREHVTTMVPTIKLALKKAKLELSDIDAIAVTAGPGLMPALMVGVDTANALSLAANIPVIPVQHITGHIYANLIDFPNPKFPLLGLVVSGGHTEFIFMKGHLKFKKIGRTLDDAAGEAFDKTAKILGLPYPGGPQISMWAEKGSPDTFEFPRPMIRDKSLNFSFAGLKTAVLYKVQELTRDANLRIHANDTNSRNSHFNSRHSRRLIHDLAASIQEALVDTLVSKTRQALQKTKAKSFTLGGGVAANKTLRERISQMIKSEFPGVFIIPTKTEYATDNAVMIAAVGAMKLHKKEKQPKLAKASPQWEI